MVNVAILGFGVVGSGVAELLDKNAGKIAQKAGQEIALKYILDLRDFPDSPYRSKLIKDFSVIEQDPSVEIVIETIGGARAARDFTIRALKAGKSVVTSNKELVAQHGCELLTLAKEHNVAYLFEASVGGGIPILRPLSQCLAANELTEVCGILNGTTNYILTHMIRSGISFETALKEAQKNGYAESDPTADIEGIDACRKICILASIAFGRHIMPEQIQTEGITKITLADLAYADSCGRKIKLLGRAIRLENGKVCVYVAPHLLGEDNPLSGVDDVFNGITVKGDAIGEVMFYGRGAGKLPTASAVVADVMDIVRSARASKPMAWLPGGDGLAVPPESLASRWYVRINTPAAQVRTLVKDAAFLGRPGAPQDETAFLTGPMTRASLDQVLTGMEIRCLLRMLD